MKKPYSISMDESTIKKIKKYNFLPWAQIVNKAVDEYITKNEVRLDKIHDGISNLDLKIHISTEETT